VLGTTALSSIAWGMLLILEPEMIFRWSRMPQPSSPEFWQCVGMISLVCGVGFAVASLEPLRHWPVVLVGFLVKVAGPIGFAWSAVRGRMPWAFGWTMLGTDVIWSIPLAIILWTAYREHAAAQRTCSPEIQRMALRARTQYGLTLLAMSTQSPIMLVFLRHAGCTFCREALSDLSVGLAAIQATGTQVVLVHMAGEETVAPFLKRYGLDGLPRVSDPHRHLYRAFGLKRGNLMNLFGPKVLWRSIEAGILKGHGIGLPVEDASQMPGIFIIFHGEILRGYQHQSAADRPNYLELAVLS